MAWENVHSTVCLTVAIISPVGYANFCTHFTILKNAKNIADKRQFPTVAKRKNPIEQNICMHMYVCVYSKTTCLCLCGEIRSFTIRACEEKKNNVSLILGSAR